MTWARTLGPLLVPLLLAGCMGGMGQVVGPPPGRVGAWQGAGWSRRVAAAPVADPWVLVFFGHDDPGLDGRSRAALDRFRAEAGSATGRCLVVSGHADAREGAASGALSRARARAVLAYLDADGLPHGPVRLDVAGAARPLVPHPDRAGWEPHNSRAEAHLGRTCRVDGG